MRDIVIYIGGMEFPDKNAAAQRVIANSKILKEHGYKVILAGLNKSDKNSGELKPVYSSQLDNFEIFSKSYPSGLLDWFKYSTQIDWVKKLIGKYDPNRIYAIIAYNYPSIALLKLQKYALKNNIKIVSDCTEWYGTNNLVKIIDSNLRMRFVQKKVKNVICISDYLQNYYKNSITVNIPSLIDKQDKKWLQTKEYYPSTERIFSYVGSPGISKEKDRLDMIIDSFLILKNKGYAFLFNIAGISEESFLEMFPTYKQKLNILREHVIFLGRIPHGNAIEIVKQSDYTIFARLENRVTMAGFPTKLAESFSCGTPVITTPTSNVSRFIEFRKNGFIAKSCSVDALVKVMEEAINVDDNILKDMHSHCRNHNPLDYRIFKSDFKAFMENIE
ncbi:MULTISPECIES: glycosyltransferase family 4 protein [unclassified Exiguobacterium]|uniref:glycosyltransferase family 4 protein n=1 Tax=unclassified Exiguobacterium TaxID=2644629 RepID=UPI001BE78C2F|nr:MULTISPECIES: glycosyltransferase family 4 protein [unclassified Exiguobacterium]